LVFGSGIETIIAAGAGPVDGQHPYLSSYRAELSGILAIAYMTFRICQYYHLSSGKLLCYCDNKGAINSAFTSACPGTTPFLRLYYDILELIRNLIIIFPITAAGSWVKGHYKGKDIKFEHRLDHTAVSLATQYNKSQEIGFKTLPTPLPPPGYKVRLLQDTTVITSKLNRTITQAIHDHILEAYIMKKYKWSPRTLHLIDWQAHKSAHSRLTWSQRISTAKLIHGLANTNYQNKVYYGTTSLCPCCSTAEESFEHVLHCPAPEMETAR
jgi:hypothetical protein